ncbi:acetylxylan esterase precursor [Fusarium agapanthi]|uniref:Acetylxylan esterase n=1 Tax=Fusarium agapanthi TaxID=1803897 RepID=A0A9P5EHH8_9HYPO|nr:acetylxylan esterase precursor [Fusarium agapanthi]
MLNTAFLASLFLIPLAIGAPAVDVEERQAPCQNVHIFLACGTDEPYPGRQSSIVSAICSGLTSCGYEDINYPASFNTYCTSIYAGITGVAAALFFGDPRHAANQAYNTGTGALRNSINPRNGA